MKIPFVLGRVLFGGYFVLSGINHLRNREQMKPYVASKGVPQPGLAVTLTAIPLLIGGTSLVLGMKPKWGALSILGFLGGVSPIMHNFWQSEDPQQRQRDMTDFMKNMALAGGALALMAIQEPWKASVPIGKRKLAHRMRRLSDRIAA
jgi:putative oxidoreductase